MKKTIAIVLCLICVLSISGCGKDKTGESVDEYNGWFSFNAVNMAYDGRNYYVLDDDYLGVRRNAIYKIRDTKTGELEMLYQAPKGEDLDGLFYSDDNLFFLDDKDCLNSLNLKTHAVTVLGEIDHYDPDGFRSDNRIYFDDYIEKGDYAVFIDLDKSKEIGKVVTYALSSDDVKERWRYSFFIGVFGNYAYVITGDDSKDSGVELKRIDVATGKEETLCSIEEIATMDKLMDAVGYYNGSILCYDFYDRKLSALELKTGQLSQYPFVFETTSGGSGTLVITKDAFFYSVREGKTIEYKLCKYSEKTGTIETIAELSDYFDICHAGNSLLVRTYMGTELYLIDLDDPEYRMVELKTD